MINEIIDPAAKYVAANPESLPIAISILMLATVVVLVGWVSSEAPVSSDNRKMYWVTQSTFFILTRLAFPLGLGLLAKNISLLHVPGWLAFAVLSILSLFAFAHLANGVKGVRDDAKVPSLDFRKAVDGGPEGLKQLRDLAKFAFKKFGIHYATGIGLFLTVTSIAGWSIGWIIMNCSLLATVFMMIAFGDAVARKVRPASIYVRGLAEPFKEAELTRIDDVTVSFKAGGKGYLINRSELVRIEEMFDVITTTPTTATQPEKATGTSNNGAQG